MAIAISDSRAAVWEVYNRGIPAIVNPSVQRVLASTDGPSLVTSLLAFEQDLIRFRDEILQAQSVSETLRVQLHHTVSLTMLDSYGLYYIPYPKGHAQFRPFSIV